MNYIPFVDLKAGFAPIKKEVMKAIETVLSDMNLFLGPNCETFENEFASFCGTRYAAGVGSGTEALQFALLACGVKSGDEIITSTHTFFATIEAIVAVGAKPVLVDIDPITYNINPAEIEKKITKYTKAIIPVHMYGLTADMDTIVDISKRYGIHIIEDACQAHGAMYNMKKTGSFGDTGCFSFYYTKNLGGYGESGIVTTNNEEIAEKIKLYRNHGHKSKYEHVVFGYNGRLDEVQAAILRIKLKYLDEYNAKRRELAERYNSLLKNTPLTLPEEPGNRKHIYHLYVVRSKKRDALQKYLADHGIGTGIHYKIPVHLQDASKDLGYKKGDFPAAESACSKILSLPMYPELAQDSQKYIAEQIREFYKNN